MRDSLLGTVSTSYDPLLEKYIGHKVVLELVKGDEIIEYCGVLRGYTKDFAEILDVVYKTESGKTLQADIIVSRKICFVRNLAEKVGDG